MKQIKYFCMLLLLAMMVCGCEPEMRQCLQPCSVEQVEEICVYQDGVKKRCVVGAEMREVLRGELETWKRAGLDGFDTSIEKFAPDVCLSFRNINSAPCTWLFKDLIEACVVNFTESVVVVNVIRRNGSTQYVRETTEADKCFRRILLEMTMQSNNHAANFQLFDWSQGLGENFRFRSNEDFAEFLKRGKEEFGDCPRRILGLEGCRAQVRFQALERRFGLFKRRFGLFKRRFGLFKRRFDLWERIEAVFSRCRGPLEAAGVGTLCSGKARHASRILAIEGQAQSNVSY